MNDQGTTVPRGNRLSFTPNTIFALGLGLVAVCTFDFWLRPDLKQFLCLAHMLGLLLAFCFVKWRGKLLE